MAALPLMTVSGIRGIYGETLTDDFAARVAYVQTKLTKATSVVVGRDTRPSGAALSKAIFRGIRAAGACPIDIGIAPTPTTCIATLSCNAGAGIIITASHNPVPYNGYKMVHASGRLCNDAECAAVYAALNTMTIPDDLIRLASSEPDSTYNAVDDHLKRILAVVDHELIRKAEISIAVDSINGAAGVIFPQLLKELGVQWTGVYNALDGNFAHNPEPRPDHLTDLAALLKKTPGLWGGFAFDPDADRLAPMGEHGEAVTEEMTLALALETILAKDPTPIATNLSTSMLIDNVGARYNISVVRTKIGEANVVAGMQANNCRAGGEGNGGIIYPRISTVRDGLAALGLILELMARTKLKMTQLVSRWPSYAVVKDKIPAGNDAVQKLANLAKACATENIDLQDGVKIIRPNGWVHLRSSNTEPIIRCYAEALTEADAKMLVNWVMEKFNAVK